MAGILCVLYASIVGLSMPFTAIHLLFINLLTDSLPAIAIGMEPSDDSLLKEKPRNPKEGILTKILYNKNNIAGSIDRNSNNVSILYWIENKYSPCYHNGICNTNHSQTIPRI